MPGDAGVTVVTMLVCFFIFARKAAGALRARHSLRPLISEGELSWQNSGASRRGNAEPYLSTSLRGAKATKQSSFP
jgi:hypothetical protein